MIELDYSMKYLTENARERLGLVALDQWTNGKKDESDLSELPLFEAMP